MKRLITIIVFLLITQTIFGQKKNIFYYSMAGGPSYFFSDNTINRRVNNTALFGINYAIVNKHQTLMFYPGLFLQFNQVGSRISEYEIVRISQRSIALKLDMLMRLSKKTLLRAGLFFNHVHYSELFVSNSNYPGGYYSYSNDELYKGYFVKNIQAGFTVGVSFLFKVVKRENKFNITLIQNASSLVESDFILSQALVGKKVKVLSTKSKPTILVIGFDFSLQRFKKKKEIEEG